MKNKLNTRIALIGGGPACATAAVQLVRSGNEAIIIAEEIGGTIKNANLIENLIGFPEGIKGWEFVNLIKAQLLNNKVPYISERVETIEYKESKYLVATSQSEIQAEYLIVGTGSTPKKLEIKGEEEAFQNNKLFYEIYEGKQFTEEKTILIIGSGDVAYDYAMNLCKTAKNISIIQRTSSTKSLPLLQERVEKESKIRIVKNREPVEIILQEEEVILLTEMENKIFPIEADLILVAIGRVPNIQFLSQELRAEYEETLEGTKLYFVGDAKKGNYRQVSIAMGDGMKAAMEINKRLTLEGDTDGTHS